MQKKFPSHSRTSTQLRRRSGANAVYPPAPPRLYRRSIDLPKLVAMWPDEIADISKAGRLRLIAKLRGALRAERRRGVAGHWTYDLARHHQLLSAYRAEIAALLAMANRPSAHKKNPDQKPGCAP